MATKKKPRRGKLSAADQEAADNLRALWERSGIKQKDLADMYQEEGDEKKADQALMSQYINGKIKIGVVATMRFARIFECSPTDIRSDFAYTDLAPGDLPPDVLKLATEIAVFNPEVRADIALWVNELRQHGATYLDMLRKLRTSPESA